MILVTPQHVGSSQSSAQTRVPCDGRWILYVWTSREVLKVILKAYMSYSFSLIFPSSLTNHWKRTSCLEVCKIIFQKWASRTNMFFPRLGKCLWLTCMIKEGDAYKIWHHHHLCPCFLALSPFELLALSQDMHLFLRAETLGLASCLPVILSCPSWFRKSYTSFNQNPNIDSSLKPSSFLPQAWCSSVLYNTLDILISPNWLHMFLKPILPFLWAPQR